MVEEKVKQVVKRKRWCYRAPGLLVCEGKESELIDGVFVLRGRKIRKEHESEGGRKGPI